MLVNTLLVLLLATMSPRPPQPTFTPSGPSACQVDCWSLVRAERLRARLGVGGVLGARERHDERPGVGEDREPPRGEQALRFHHARMKRVRVRGVLGRDRELRPSAAARRPGVPATRARPCRSVPCPARAARSDPGRCSSSACTRRTRSCRCAAPCSTNRCRRRGTGRRSPCSRARSGRTAVPRLARLSAKGAPAVPTEPDTTDAVRRNRRRSTR